MILGREEGRGKGGGGEEGGERNIDWLPPVHAPTRDGTHNLGIYSDQGLNLHNLLVHGTMFQLSHLVRATMLLLSITWPEGKISV